MAKKVYVRVKQKKVDIMNPIVLFLRSNIERIFYTALYFIAPYNNSLRLWSH